MSEIVMLLGLARRAACKSRKHHYFTLEPQRLRIVVIDAMERLIVEIIEVRRACVFLPHAAGGQSPLLAAGSCAVGNRSGVSYHVTARFRRVVFPAGVIVSILSTSRQSFQKVCGRQKDFHSTWRCSHPRHEEDQFGSRNPKALVAVDSRLDNRQRSVGKEARRTRRLDAAAPGASWEACRILDKAASSVVRAASHVGTIEPISRPVGRPPCVTRRQSLQLLLVA